MTGDKPRRIVFFIPFLQSQSFDLSQLQLGTHVSYASTKQSGAAQLVDYCQLMLSHSRYLSSSDIAADIQLRQFVRQWCRAVHGNALCPFSDRNRSLDLLLQELGRLDAH